MQTYKVKPGYIEYGIGVYSLCCSYDKSCPCYWEYDGVEGCNLGFSTIKTCVYGLQRLCVSSSCRLEVVKCKDGDIKPEMVNLVDK